MDVVVAGYGALLCVGGAMGFRKGSLPSLLAGGGSGLFFLMAAQNIEDNKFSARIVASLLCLGMSIRAKKSGKMMPAGMVAILSGLVAFYLFQFK